MNHCRDCNSDYATPGSCNCFAPGGKRAAAPDNGSPWAPSPLPWAPLPMPTTPWPMTPGPLWWYVPTTTTDTITFDPATITFTNAPPLATATGWVTLAAALDGAPNCCGM